MTENTKNENASKPSPIPESSTIMDLVLPFKVLVSPLRAFGQLAQRPTAKGLVTLVVFILAITAAAQYASATKIILTVNGQLTSFTATDVFADWFTRILATTNLYIVLYWLVFAVGLALVSRFFGGKEVKLRSSFVVLGYLLSVLMVLYTVRTITYLALPPIAFETGSWPPVEQADIDAALSRMSQNWGPLLAYQFGTYFTFVSFAWLVLLGVVAVKALRDISWPKASVVSVVGFLFTVFLFGFGLP